MTKVTGINHITLSVTDLTRAIKFYTEVLGCHLHATWRNGAYLEAGTFWLCLSVDEYAKTEMIKEYTHIAFHVDPQDFEALSNKIIKSGATIWKENKSEGESLYFLDLDFHKLELHYSTLQDRLKACREKPYAEMIFFD